MAEINSIEDLASQIKIKLNWNWTTNKKKVIALYAFNATGKTRLSNLLNGENENWNDTEEEIEAQSENIKTLCYNAFLEDMFVWDNENFILKFNPNSWIIKLVVDEGLEKNIIDNFKDIINDNDIKLEPSFDFRAWEVKFKIASGDNEHVDNIKISKGEESVFIWSVFYTVLQTAISDLILIEENRSTDIFNNLEYIIIDDPVSSIDDTKIITMAIKLIEAIKSYNWNTVKFLITTHHALFYNVLVNSFRLESRSKQFLSFSLSRDNNIFHLEEQWDSPFSYHLAVKELIQKAITNDSIEKYHFNLFRALLEKTANFLGYENWYNCIVWDNKQESIRLLNLYSHSRLSDLESNELSIRDKSLFQQIFNDFIQQFNWNN